MLVIRIELHSAVTRRVKTIGKMIISNRCTHAGGKREDYDVEVGRRDKLNTVDVMRNPLRKGRVEDYPRLSYNVWRLVIRALLSAFPEETKHARRDS